MPLSKNMNIEFDIIMKKLNSVRDYPPELRLTMESFIYELSKICIKEMRKMAKEDRVYYFYEISALVISVVIFILFVLGVKNIWMTILTGLILLFFPIRVMINLMFIRSN